jgi:hypothetical protein
MGSFFFSVEVPLHEQSARSNIAGSIRSGILIIQSIDRFASSKVQEKVVCAFLQQIITFEN